MRRLILASLLLAALGLPFAFTATADDFDYVFNNMDGLSEINGADVRTIVGLAERVRGRFLWARIGGEEYLIRDTATLVEAKAAFRDAEALHRECEALEARMRPLEDREDELEDQIDDLTDRADDDGEPIDTVRLERLRDEIKAVRRQLRELEKEEARLEQREDVLDAEAEKTLRKVIERAIASGIASRYD
jgi:prefoldin subunit 5